MLPLEERRKQALKVISILEKITKKMKPPMVSQVIELYGKNPFLILISCLLSLRSRDVITLPIVKKLFEKAQTPEGILKIPLNELERILFPVGFYKKKSRLLHEVSKYLLEKFNGKVPKKEEELLSIKGVGRKTANLVLSEAFDIPAICVDTHVHKIANKLGWVKTKKPEETEKELKKVIPRNKWMDINRLLVTLGQNMPLSRICSVDSPLYSFCPK